MLISQYLYLVIFLETSHNPECLSILGFNIFIRLLANAVMESDVPEGQGTTKKKRRKKLCRSKSLLDRILTFSECRCMNLRATCFAHAGFSFITEPDTVGVMIVV